MPVRFVRLRRIGKVIVFTGIICLLATPFLPAILDRISERWKSFALAEKAHSLIGGQLYSPNGGPLEEIFVASESGQLWKCNIDSLQCNDTMVNCLSRIACDQDNVIASATALTDQHSRTECYFSGSDYWPSPITRSVPIDVQARTEYKHCASGVAPTLTYAFVGTDGSVWLSQRTLDDHGTGMAFVLMLGCIVALLLFVVGGAVLLMLAIPAVRSRL